MSKIQVFSILEFFQVHCIKCIICNIMHYIIYNAFILNKSNLLLCVQNVKLLWLTNLNCVSFQSYQFNKENYYDMIALRAVIVFIHILNSHHHLHITD